MKIKASMHAFGRAVFISSLLTLSGCVSFTYVNDSIENLVMARKPDQALMALELRRDNSRDQVIRYLDKAMLLRMKGDFTTSNDAFEIAKRINEELDAISLREQVGAMSLNESVKSYFSPPFERAMLHIYKALNYLEMDDLDSARVEIMQLSVFNKNIDDEEVLASSHYISGLVFDSLREYSGALIEYRKAFEQYIDRGLEVPQKLKEDLLRLTKHQGLHDEHDKFQKDFEIKNWNTQKEYSKQGELVFILSNGMVPRKHDQSITVQDPKNGQIHRIATPFYEARKSSTSHAVITTNSKSTKTEESEKLDIHAQAALDKEMPKIITRAIARVSIKNRVVDNARESNPLLGAIVNIAGVISEQADTRAWYTLPQEIHIGRLNLQPGNYDFEIEYIGSHGQTLRSETFNDVTIKAAEKTFLSSYQPTSHVVSRRPRR